MGKDITEMTELITADVNTWVEVVDLNETDPTLQNKKMKQSNSAVSVNDHVQDTDTILDSGGLFQVSAAAIVSYLSWKEPMSYNIDDYAAFTSNGKIALAAYTISTTGLKIGKENNFALDIKAILSALPTGTFILMVSQSASLLMETAGITTDDTTHYSVSIHVRAVVGTFSILDEVRLTIIKL